jgi:pantoate ligase/cytidylate kinase
MEGRDIGTQVFPHAELKIFLTASVAERARRRQQDLKAQQQPIESLAALERAIDDRDRKDSTRRVAPLRKAEDAVELITDGLTIDQVVDKIVLMYKDRIGDVPIN